MSKVLILDGHSPAALAFVRSLGRSAHWVAVGHSEGSFAPATLSRYCRVSFQYPNPITGMAHFVDRIQKLVQQQSIDLVVPMTDATIFPLSCMREQFRGLALLVIPSHEAIELVSDKYKTISLAKKFLIPVPETTLVHSVDDFKIKSEWIFPLVIKDRFSIRWVQDRGVLGGVSYAYSEDDLRSKVEQRLNKVEDVLVQEFIGGVGIGISCFTADGDIYLPFQWRRIREKDPRGSGSSARKSESLDSQLLKFGQKLIVGTGFQGISMIEFKKDLHTGSLVLMEINGRPWGSIQLPIHCGIDYPQYLVKWYLEDKIPPKEIDYKKRITCRWLVADLIHLENLKEGKPTGWPTVYPSFFKSLLKIIIPWYPGLRYDHFSLRDPKPGIADLIMWLRNHFFGDFR